MAVAGAGTLHPAATTGAMPSSQAGLTVIANRVAGPQSATTPSIDSVGCEAHDLTSFLTSAGSGLVCVVAGTDEVPRMYWIWMPSTAHAAATY